MATLEQLDQKLDDLKELVQLSRTEAKDKFEKHEERLGALERWRAYVIGISAAITVVIGRIFH